MKCEVRGDLLIVEFSSLDDLHSTLSERLVKTETVGVKISDYTGLNYSKKVLKKHDVKGLLLKLVERNNVEYVIGYVKGDVDTYEHEIRHYKYYSDKDYRKSCDEMFKDRKELISIVRGKGYRENVILDEVQAHFNTY